MKKVSLIGISLLSAAVMMCGCNNTVSPSDSSYTSTNIFYTPSEFSVPESTEESPVQSPAEIPDESSDESPDESSDESSDESPAESPAESPEPSVSTSSQPSETESSQVSESPEPSPAESSQTSEISQEPKTHYPDEDTSDIYGIDRKYFVNKLSEEQRKNFAVLYHAAINGEEKAVFHRTVKEDELDTLMWLLNYDCPELIHLKGDYSPMSEGNNIVSGVYFFYNMTPDEYAECCEKMNAFFDDLKKQTDGMDEYETEKYVYDMMFDSLTYTETTDHSGSAYGALIEHKARCEGISKGFAWCMNELGIDCITISGYPLWENNSMYASHSWNIIHLGSSCYHVDLTADNLKESEDQTVYPLYSFLNQSDAVMQSTHKPLDLYTSLGMPACEDDDMNYHVMNGLVITPDDDPKEALWELLDRYFSPEGEVYIMIRFTDENIYESFTNTWETYYDAYIEEKGLDYRYAMLYFNDVGKTVGLHIDEQS